MIRRSSRRTKRFRSSPRNKRFCDLKPRSKYCKVKVDKKVKPYSGGKLNRDEICHNCTDGAYSKGARRFCKLHDKVWEPKTNSCRKKKTKKQKGGRMNKQNWEKNEGYFGKVMDKNGKLNRDEICHNCWPSGYAKEARKFCKLHDKVWEPKTNSCRKKKTKKQKGGALCLPCISPILSGLGVLGAGAAATVAGAGAMTMTSSKISQSGDNIEREQSFDKNISRTHKKSKKSKKTEEKLKFHITQKNNKVTYKRNNEKMKTKVFTKSKSMKDNINKASNFYNKKIEYCVVKGYKKC